MFPSSAKVLVVDDLKTMRAVVKKNLALCGLFNVSEAEDGSMAWEMILEKAKRSSVFDLIISDLNMPKMHGIDLLKKVRSHESTKDIPFFIISTDLTESRVTEALENGVSGYINKPFSVDTLKENLASIHDKSLLAQKGVQNKVNPELLLDQDSASIEEKPVRILLVEDSAVSAKVIMALIKEIPGKFSAELKVSLQSALDRLKMGGIELILLDLTLPDSEEHETVQKVSTAFPQIPIVVLTSMDDEAIGLRAVREGSQDFLVKGRVDGHLLFRTIRYAIERKRTEHLLLEAEKSLIQTTRLASLVTIAGGVAHEINNPAAVISLTIAGSKKLLASNKVDVKKMELGFKIIENMIGKITNITGGLLDFARDSQDDPFVSVKLREIYEKTILFCEAKMNEKEITISCEMPEQLEMKCRASEISKVLLHLLNNSYDAIKNKNERWIKIQAVDQDSFIEISVTDNGEGIAPEFIKRIFEPFFTTKDIGSGAGLGLSISKGIIAAHGGDIFYDERSPHTRFVMQFPKH